MENQITKKKLESRGKVRERERRKGTAVATATKSIEKHSKALPRCALKTVVGKKIKAARTEDWGKEG